MRFEVIIGGMLSVHAQHGVYMALGAVEGALSAEVDMGRAVVWHDGRATEAAIRAAVGAVGYDVLEVRALPRILPTI